MSNIYAHWHKYTQEVLAWAVDANHTAISFNIDNDSQKTIKRLLEYGQRNEWYILLGCDKICLELAHALPQNSPIQILILESDLHLARAFLDKFDPLPSNVHILADTSPWALFLLTHPLCVEGPKPNNAMIHWVKEKHERTKALITWRKLFLGTKLKRIAKPKAQQLKLSVGAIMHPSEAHLESFFAQIPKWIHELIIIWDGPIPQNNWPCNAKVKHFSRALNNDFSAQRNAMLKYCSGDWLFYLDADERLTAKSWEQLANLVTNENIGVYFPRLTFEGDEQHIRMGFGLWPDLQLRLFPLEHGVHFTGSIHEKVAGLTANLYLATHIPILHYSHVYKSREELRQRLATFSASGNIEHKLSQAYPRLEHDFFENLAMHDNISYIFQLPS